MGLPILTAAAVVGISLLVHSAHTPGAAAGPTMVRLVADLFPVTAGLAAAAVLGRESALELQLTVPTDYRTTVCRRLTVLAVAVLLGAIGCLSAVVAAGQWAHAAQGPVALLIPLAPALLLLGTGAFAAVHLGSAAGASMVVLGVWLAHLLILDRLIGDWPTNRAILLFGGLGLLLLAGRGLADTEAVLAHTSRGDKS